MLFILVYVDLVVWGILFAVCVITSGKKLHSLLAPAYANWTHNQKEYSRQFLFHKKREIIKFTLLFLISFAAMLAVIVLPSVLVICNISIW